MTENCENCVSFDPSRHANDKRTQHMGICTKFCEISFKWEKCNQFFSKENTDNLKNTPGPKIENINVQTFLTF